MLTIRQYSPDDHAAVMKLHVVAMERTGAYLGDGPWDDDLKDVQGVYLDQGGEFLVGEVSGHVVAMGAFRRDEATPSSAEVRAEIKRMRVHPDVQGRGYGQQMFRALEMSARQRGITTFYLETSVVLHAAQHLYRKNGFVETHRGKVQHMDCIWFEKTLSSADD